MISFNKPTNVNGFELRQELNEAGISIVGDVGTVLITTDGLLWLDIAESDAQAAEAIVAAHNGTI
jgi:hypothetical protein